MRLVGIYLFILASAIGCETPAPPGQNEVTCTCEPGTRPVNSTLLSFLSKARAVHHQADLAEDQGDRVKALAILGSLVSGPTPESLPEVDEVLADTRARMAELHGGLGQWEAAEKDLEQGFAHAQGISYFRGHLFEVQAIVEKQRAASLTADPAAAEQARTRAIQAAEQAIEIQDQVLRRTLKKGIP